MIDVLINGSLNFLMAVLNFILAPIDSLIDNYIPSLDIALETISDLFSYVGSVIPWVTSWLHFPRWFWLLLFSYTTFRLVVFFGVSTIKTLLAWFQRIKFW